MKNWFSQCLRERGKVYCQLKELSLHSGFRFLISHFPSRSLQQTLPFPSLHSFIQKALIFCIFNLIYCIIYGLQDGLIGKMQCKDLRSVPSTHVKILLGLVCICNPRAGEAKTSRFMGHCSQASLIALLSPRPARDISQNSG